MLAVIMLFRVLKITEFSICQLKAHMRLLLVNNTNLRPILHCLPDIAQLIKLSHRF